MRNHYGRRETSGWSGRQSVSQSAQQSINQAGEQHGDFLFLFFGRYDVFVLTVVEVRDHMGCQSGNRAIGGSFLRVMTHALRSAAQRAFAGGQSGGQAGGQSGGQEAGGQSGGQAGGQLYDGMGIQAGIHMDDGTIWAFKNG